MKPTLDNLESMIKNKKRLRRFKGSSLRNLISLRNLAVGGHSFLVSSKDAL